MAHPEKLACVLASLSLVCGCSKPEKETAPVVSVQVVEVKQTSLEKVISNRGGSVSAPASRNHTKSARP